MSSEVWRQTHIPSHLQVFLLFLRQRTIIFAVFDPVMKRSMLDLGREMHVEDKRNQVRQHVLIDLISFRMMIAVSSKPLGVFFWNLHVQLEKESNEMIHVFDGRAVESERGKIKGGLLEEGVDSSGAIPIGDRGALECCQVDVLLYGGLREWSADISRSSSGIK